MNNDFSSYLQSCEIINHKNDAITQKAKALRANHANTLNIAKACFEFVRDDIKHSSDYELNPVTIKASDVLLHSTGYCYAKSHLLTALLRANNIPSALCYQRLTITDEPPFCLHGLCAIYLDDYGWYKVDARGNKPTINAQFIPPVEQLAFTHRVEGESHIDGLYASPPHQLIAFLHSCDNWKDVYNRLHETDTIF